MPQMMKIQEILQTVTNSIDCDFDGTPLSWALMMREKVSHRMIEWLVEEGQQYPIYIGTECQGCDYEDEDRCLCDDTLTIGNGHHRLVAAILLGWDEILVESDVADYCHWSTGHDEDTCEEFACIDCDFCDLLWNSLNDLVKELARGSR